MDHKDIAQLIGDSQKRTPVKVFIKGKVISRIPREVLVFQGVDSIIAIGDYAPIKNLLQKNKSSIEYVYLENDRRNSALPLLDLKNLPARIEPGAIIRDMVKIGKDCIIMMGAVINIGAEIGSRTMIDMNAVVGARCLIGKDCHIGAGAVIAGVLEPPSTQSVAIHDKVVIGANAVILEGITVGKNSVVAAGAVVTKNVKPNSVVGGVPAKFIKNRDSGTDSKTALVKLLRKR